MEGGVLAEAMVVVVDCLGNAREGPTGLDRAIETIIGTTGRFNGRDITNISPS